MSRRQPSGRLDQHRAATAAQVQELLVALQGGPVQLPPPDAQFAAQSGVQVDAGLGDQGCPRGCQRFPSRPPPAGGQAAGRACGAEQRRERWSVNAVARPPDVRQREVFPVVGHARSVTGSVAGRLVEMSPETRMIGLVPAGWPARRVASCLPGADRGSRRSRGGQVRGGGPCDVPRSTGYACTRRVSKPSTSLFGRSNRPAGTSSTPSSAAAGRRVGHRVHDTVERRRCRDHARGIGPCRAAQSRSAGGGTSDRLVGVRGRGAQDAAVVTAHRRGPPRRLRPPRDAVDGLPSAARRCLADGHRGRSPEGIAEQRSDGGVHVGLQRDRPAGDLLPVHHDEATGLPVGIQIVAAPWREDLLLQVSHTLELVLPWAGRRPAVS